jgi:hypothetical protein
MSRSKSLILTLTLCALIGGYPKAQSGQDNGDLPDQNDMDPILIALTRLDVNDLILDVNDQPLDVNDQTLELRYKVKNDSDHDIWVCDSVGFIEDEFEVFMEDDQTLLVRKRLDVPTFVVYYIWPEGQYSRLRAGEERVKSLSINLPVHHHWMFMPRLEKQGVIYARRLVLEIGYHTKDLAQIILDLKGSGDDPNKYNKAIISYLHSANEGEHVLRITVDGLLIPYEDVWTQDAHGKAKAEKESEFTHQ